jgi:murein DD-endopeptidase MepM/ murein hydrolase activator NlpD
MLSLSRRSTAAGAAALLLAVAAALAGTPGGSPARADRASQLQNAVDAKRARERNLLGGIAADNAQINRYGGSIAALQARLSRVQAALAVEQAQLAQLQTQERIEQSRLARLELQLQQADQALARNLVGSYESDQPDALTVILDARGFADLIERVDFLKRIKHENTMVIGADRAARVRVIAEADRLGALEARAQTVTASMTAQRNQVDGLRIALVQRQLVFIRARAGKQGALQATAAERQRLEGSLAALQAAAARPAPGSGSGGGSVSSGQVLSSGGFTFPLPGGAASGPGSWSQDQGVDISAAGDTPELAVGSGTIVLHGIGGFGAWAPVLHLDSPIAGQSYVYYGHAGPQGELPVGTHVGAGAVIGSVGPGIVGISTGPHLEIGFADASGTPAGGTSGEMMSLLQGAYHG